MRHPRRRRPRRSYRWTGLVVDIGDTVFARLLPDGHAMPEVFAEFDPEHFHGAVEGSIFTMYVHRRGRKVRTVIRLRNPRPWTADELAALDEQVAQRMAQLSAAGYAID